MLSDTVSESETKDSDVVIIKLPLSVFHIIRIDVLLSIIS